MDPLNNVAAVAIVLALLGTFVAVVRSRGARVRLPWMRPGDVSQTMQVMERVALSPQHTLCLVRVGGRSVLISTSPSSCQILEVGPS
jgi:flagellar biogenesis protein FliO